MPTITSGQRETSPGVAAALNKNPVAIRSVLDHANRTMVGVSDVRSGATHVSRAEESTAVAVTT